MAYTLVDVDSAVPLGDRAKHWRDQGRARGALHPVVSG